MRGSGLVLVLILIAAPGAAGCADPSAAGDIPPVVILVAIDTLRADHLTPYGYDVRLTTPALDRWAESAVMFERAYSSSSWTLPAFGTILTGRWPSAHGAGTHSRGLDGDNWTALDEASTTLPELFQRAGFETAAVVNNLYLNERFGVAQGFDVYDWRNGTDSTWRPASESVDVALGWLREHRSQPRFLMLHLMEPHFSYRAPEGFQGYFRTEEEMAAFEVPSADGSLLFNGIEEFSEAEWDLVRAAYDEEIAYVDHQIDRFFSGLQELGLWDDALVVFTSDHGEEFLDHGNYGHGRTMYDEVTRVPLLVWWKQAVPRRVDTPVSIADIFPTLAETIDAEVEVDGVSLVDILRRPGGSPDRLLLLERNQFDSEQEDFGAVSWPDKLIIEAEQQQLFDLVRDPEERTDLATAAPVALTDLLDEAEASIALASRSATVARNPELDEEAREALRALGYIQ